MSPGFYDSNMWELKTFSLSLNRCAFDSAANVHLFKKLELWIFLNFFYHFNLKMPVRHIKKYKNWFHRLQLWPDMCGISPQFIHRASLLYGNIYYVIPDNYSLFLLSLSSDHDSEGKRVQDMLSTIEKPQVGTPLPAVAHAHTLKLLSSITCLSDAVTAGLSSDDFSICLFGFCDEMLTLRIIATLTCVCITFLIF